MRKQASNEGEGGDLHSLKRIHLEQTNSMTPQPSAETTIRRELFFVAELMPNDIIPEMLFAAF
jgi:hypothetical protein